MPGKGRQAVRGAAPALGGGSCWGLRTTVSGTRADGAGGDPTGRALARLEAAVERLADAASRPRPVAAPGAAGEGVSRAAVAAIADRLDETIARLRAALGEDQ